MANNSLIEVEIDLRNPWTRLPASNRRGWFNFALISDRTGGARPGVFERGLACTDLLSPMFAVQLGDLIEGYTNDHDEIGRQWDELDATIETLQTPLFRVPGNHDVSTPAMADVWNRRYGRRYYHFRCDEVLFLVVDTQDPPSELPPDVLARMRSFEDRAIRDPITTRPWLESAIDWEGTQPAKVSEEQHQYLDDVLRRHRDARWTFVFMHMPMWQGDHPAWQRLRRSLGTRPYTAFAGHVHNYQRRVLDGHDHIRLGPTGGVWVLSGPEGNFDHISLVTMTDSAPVITSVTLNGFRDVDGQPVLPITLTTVPVA